MRYFDPSLQRGLIPGVKVTPLRGDHWTLGPIAGKLIASAAGVD
jgi:rare lipoprotein A